MLNSGFNLTALLGSVPSQAQSYYQLLQLIGETAVLERINRINRINRIDALTQTTRSCFSLLSSLAQGIVATTAILISMFHIRLRLLIG